MPVTMMKNLVLLLLATPSPAFACVEINATALPYSPTGLGQEAFAALEPDKKKDPPVPTASG